MKIDQPILTVRDVAKLLQMSEQSVRGLARRGKIPGRRVGKEWRFNREAIESLVPPPPAQQGAA